MKEALDIILSGFRANWKRATKEVLSLLAILALAFLLLYAWDMPEPTRDHSIWAEYRASVVRGH